jgi:hypothetical protein
MELSEMLATKPSEYLVNGFYDQSGEYRDDLNGFYSLGMAYRLREEGLNPENVDRVVNGLEAIADQHIDAVDENPEQPVDAKSQDQLKKLRNGQEVAGSAALSELLDAAQSHISNWKDFAGLVVHLDRIIAQLALLTSLPKD